MQRRFSGTNNENGNFVVTGGHCLNVENGEIESVQATFFPSGGNRREKMATSWYRNGNVALVYFQEGFDDVNVLRLPMRDHLDRVRDLRRGKMRLTFFNPLLGEFKNKEEALAGRLQTMDAKFISMRGGELEGEHGIHAPLGRRALPGCRRSWPWRKRAGGGAV